MGELELREVAKVSVTAYHDTISYYIIDSERYKDRNIQAGIYYKDIEGKMHHLLGKQVEAISRIYDKLTRID